MHKSQSQHTEIPGAAHSTLVCWLLEKTNASPQCNRTVVCMRRARNRQQSAFRIWSGAQNTTKSVYSRQRTVQTHKNCSSVNVSTDTDVSNYQPQAAMRNPQILNLHASHLNSPVLNQEDTEYAQTTSEHSSVRPADVCIPNPLRL